MSFYLVNGQEVSLTPSGFYSVDRTPAGGGGAVIPDGIAPVWAVEYVDPSGVLRKTAISNDGGTAINIRQYANVTIDGKGTRSSAAGCDTAGGAAQVIGYGVNYGEALGTSWGTSGYSTDYDFGPPIFSRCFTAAGSKTVTLYARDPDGRDSAVTFTVNVDALGSVVDISAGGSWPTWADGVVYGLSSGDYSSRGAISTPARYGIRIVKIGGGSDPITGAFQPETRGLTEDNITDRSRDIALVGIDYAQFQVGIVGASYCGSYGGNCRHFGEGTTWPMGYIYSEAIQLNNATRANNTRVQRGTFVVNASAIDGSAALPNYAFIAQIKSANFAGTTFRRTTGNSGGNPMRTYFQDTVLRHVQVYSTTETFGCIKGSLRANVYSARPDDPWPDDDTYGSFALSRASWLANGNGFEGNWGTGGSYTWFCKNVFGGPGAYNGLFVAGYNSQNDDPPSNGLTGPWSNEDSYETGFIGGFEDNTTFETYSAQATIAGQDMSVRNNRFPSGALWPFTVGSSTRRTHPDMQGPYYTAARPVPAALVGLT